MSKKLFLIGLAFTVLALTPLAHAQTPEKITGPWLWLIAPTNERWNDGQELERITDIDSLAVASGSAVTEADVAVNGAEPGDVVGNYAWQPGFLVDDSNTGGLGNNINKLVKQSGVARGHLAEDPSYQVLTDNHAFYGLIMLSSDTAQSALMHVGSDDMVKIWLNGTVVHNNPAARGASDFQETLPINLEAGENLLLVKVNNTYGHWTVYVGVEGNVTAEGISEELDTAALVSLSPSPLELPDVGESFTLNLEIAEAGEISGYEATIRFNYRILHFLGSEPGDFLPDTFVVPPSLTENVEWNIDEVTIAATSLGDASSGEGTLATLTFLVLQRETSVLDISRITLINPEGHRTFARIQNGEVVPSGPAGPAVAGDVNRDSVVNIQDLVMIASLFGQQDEHADVNGDGIVDIADLVLVASAIGGSAGAPSIPGRALDTLAAADVQRWVAQAQQATLIEPASQRGIRFLQRLLAALTPKATVLLPNYPNPFNPETWLPYQLATSADVTLTIYTANGAVVRVLDLGHRMAGLYRSQSRAAYWDGRNAQGEPVASGVYFYTLTAGNFSATRKMLIWK